MSDSHLAVPGAAVGPDTTPRVRPATTANWLIARILAGGIDGLCVITDLTPVGAKAMTVLELAVDQAVVLDAGDGLRLAAQVRWVDATRVGLEFDPPLDAPALSALSGGDNPAPRFRRCLPVTLARHGREAEARLIEISTAGACIEAAHEPWIREGAEIEVEIEGFYPAEADVNWIKDGRIGIEFRTPMQLWRLDNQLRVWASECSTCPNLTCHTGVSAPASGRAAGPSAIAQH